MMVSSSSLRSSKENFLPQTWSQDHWALHPPRGISTETVLFHLLPPKNTHQVVRFRPLLKNTRATRQLQWVVWRRILRVLLIWGKFKVTKTLLAQKPVISDVRESTQWMLREKTFMIAEMTMEVTIEGCQKWILSKVFRTDSTRDKLILTRKSNKSGKSTKTTNHQLYRMSQIHQPLVTACLDSADFQQPIWMRTAVQEDLVLSV